MVITKYFKPFSEEGPSFYANIMNKVDRDRSSAFIGIEENGASFLHVGETSVLAKGYGDYKMTLVGQDEYAVSTAKSKLEEMGGSVLREVESELEARV